MEHSMNQSSGAQFSSSKWRHLHINASCIEQAMQERDEYPLNLVPRSTDLNVQITDLPANAQESAEQKLARTGFAKQRAAIQLHKADRNIQRKKPTTDSVGPGRVNAASLGWEL